MQRTSMIIIFSFSTALCTGAIASLGIQSRPLLTGKRLVATVEKSDKPIAKSLPRSYKIASAFRRSRAIWGVYDKVQDRLEPQKQPGTKVKTIKTSLGELILKDGQVVLVSPLSHDGVTQVEVAKLPYEKVGKDKYDIDLKKATIEQKDALVRLYAPLIDGIEGSDNTTIEHMNCFKKKSRLSCELDIRMQ